VVTSVSQATRPAVSWDRTASRTASETWSATLSGWPSVTDSEVNEKLCAAISPKSSRTPERSLFALRAAAHQRRRQLLQALAVEHAADGLRDRQLDSEAVREVAEHGRGRQALDDLADLGGRLAGRRSAGDQLAGTAVPSEAAPAGDHQV